MTILVVKCSTSWEHLQVQVSKFKLSAFINPAGMVIPMGLLFCSFGQATYM